MGTTAQKLEYLGTTKSQLKDMINYGLDDDNKITSTTTFRNYVGSVFKAFLESLNNPSTLFNNLPKITGSGSNITLNNTANAPMRIMLNATDITQDGTPTPDSPQDIHTISGDNSIEVCGKNLFNLETAYHGTINAQGVVGSNESFRTTQYITSSPNTNYYFSTTQIEGQTNKQIYIAYYDNNKTFLSRDSYNDLAHLFTTPSNCYYIRAGVFTANQENVMLEKGSTATSYEPYVSQEADVNLGDIEYSKIGNYQDQFIRTSGENLIPTSPDDWEQGSFDPNTGAETNTTTRIRTKDFYPIKNDTYYYISMQNTYYCFLNIMLFDRNKNFLGQYFDAISTAINGATSLIINMPSSKISNVAYMKVMIRNKDNVSTITSNVISDILPMLNEGTTALPYEPYGSNEWYIKKNIGKVVLDGSEEWRVPGSNDDNIVACNLLNTSIYDFADKELKQYFNRFKWVTYKAGWSAALSAGVGAYTNIEQNVFKYVYFVIPKTIASDVASWITWLSNNNIIAYYVLATPTYTQITGTLAEQLEYVYQLLKSYKGVTNISQVNNDLAFELDVEAVEELI